MNKNQLIAILNQTDFEVRTDYSGRGMYGKSCPAVKLESLSDLYTLGAKVYALMNRVSNDDDEDQESFEDVSEPALDNLGRGYIAYWPRITE